MDAVDGQGPRFRLTPAGNTGIVRMPDSSERLLQREGSGVVYVAPK